jgi:peptidoglycan/xylan/chitin deacetylase (PgdA/CDA1 family)
MLILNMKQHLLNLVYHSVPIKIQSTRNLHAVYFEEFKKQMRHLINNLEYTPVRLGMRPGRGYSEKRLFSVSFDDGYRNIFYGAVPWCVEHGIPVTIFITGKMLDGFGFWRDKVREIIARGLIPEFNNFMHRNGYQVFPTNDKTFYQSTKDEALNSAFICSMVESFTDTLEVKPQEEQGNPMDAAKPTDLITHSLVSYGNHGYSHYNMATLSYSQQRADIARNEDFLHRHIPDRFRTRIFGLPFGGATKFNSVTKMVLNDLGFEGLALCRNRLAWRFFESNYFPIIERYLAPLTAQSLENEIKQMTRRTLVQSLKDCWR